MSTSSTSSNILRAAVYGLVATSALGQLPNLGTPVTSSIPTLPTLPSVPGVPGVPGIPTVPAVPDVTSPITGALGGLPLGGLLGKKPGVKVVHSKADAKIKARSHGKIKQQARDHFPYVDPYLAAHAYPYAHPSVLYPYGHHYFHEESAGELDSSAEVLVESSQDSSVDSIGSGASEESQQVEPAAAPSAESKRHHYYPYGHGLFGHGYPHFYHEQDGSMSHSEETASFESGSMEVVLTESSNAAASTESTASTESSTASSSTEEIKSKRHHAGSHLYYPPPYAFPYHGYPHFYHEQDGSMSQEMLTSSEYEEVVNAMSAMGSDSTSSTAPEEVTGSSDAANAERARPFGHLYPGYPHYPYGYGYPYPYPYPYFYHEQSDDSTSFEDFISDSTESFESSSIDISQPIPTSSETVAKRSMSKPKPKSKKFGGALHAIYSHLPPHVSDDAKLGVPASVAPEFHVHHKQSAQPTAQPCEHGHIHDDALPVTAEEHNETEIATPQPAASNTRKVNIN